MSDDPSNNRFRILLMLLFCAPLVFPTVVASQEPAQPASQSPVALATQPAAAATVSKSIVTFYFRKPMVMAWGWHAEIVVDNREIAELSTDTYATFALDPGKHKFRASKKEDEFELVLAPGQHYYIRASVMQTTFSGYTSLSAICPDIGHSESTSKGLEPTKKIKDTSRYLKEVGARVPASPAASSKSEGSARVVVYRPWRLGGELLNTSVYVDGAEVADLDDRTVITLQLPAGAHRFRSDELKDEFELTLLPETTTYLRVDLQVGVLKGHGRVYVVDSSRGRIESRTKSMRPAKDVRKPELLAKEVEEPAPSAGAPHVATGEAEAKAAVRVYFPKPELGPNDVTAVLGTVSLFVDGAETAKLDDLSYVDLEVPPGMHNFYVGKDINAFQMQLEPGSQTYLRIEFDGTFYPVCTEQAISETSRARLKRTTKILKPEIVKSP